MQLTLCFLTGNPAAGAVAGLLPCTQRPPPPGNLAWAERVSPPCLSEDLGTLREPTGDPVPPGSWGAAPTCLPPAGGDRGLGAHLGLGPTGSHTTFPHCPRRPRTPHS